MINPTAIIELDNATVETRDGPEENVNRIAVWDWSEIDDDGTAVLKLHTNNGDTYVETDDVDEITQLG